MPIGTIDIPEWAQVTMPSIPQFANLIIMIWKYLWSWSLSQISKCVEYFCITYEIDGFWPITNFSSRSAHLAKCRLELRWKVFLIAKFSLMSSHFLCSEFIWKHMFMDCLFIFCFQSSAAYHASLAHKTNHSFLPNGLFKYFDRYALSTQRLFHFLKVHFAHCTFRPICCVRPPQIWSHTLYINNCRHRRRGRGKNKLYGK